MILIPGCTTLAKQLSPPPELERTYEFSLDNKSMVYSYTCEKTIFGNVKKLCLITHALNEENVKRLKASGFKITIPRNN